MGPSSMDTKKKISTMSAEEMMMNTTMLAIIVAIVFVVLINWIMNCAFIQSYGYPILLLIGGLCFGLAKASLTIRWQADWRYTILFMVLLLIGGWFITDSNLKYEKGGSIFLGLLFIVDIIYLILCKYTWKMQIDMTSFVVNIIGDLLLMIDFFYAYSQTN